MQHLKWKTDANQHHFNCAGDKKSKNIYNDFLVYLQLLSSTQEKMNGKQSVCITYRVHSAFWTLRKDTKKSQNWGKFKQRFFHYFYKALFGHLFF